MRKIGIGFVAISVLMWGQCLAELSESEKNGTEIPVQKVVLFSSGVGYFEHMGSVVGESSTDLRFKAQQINDVLKSLVLEDLDGGEVSRIVYPSQEPVSKILRSFQVDITENPSLGELLNQLRGAKVSLTAPDEVVEGTILGLEQKEETVGENDHVITLWVLNLISGGNIRSFELDDLRKIELQDPQLQDELGKALLALSEARDQEKKPVSIHFKGEGKRRVRLGYVVETPIWKTSYRLILPEKAGEQGKIQGWAIVENETDSDWNDVELSLVSGQPISFVEELYPALYISRPVVQPQIYTPVQPQIYAGGMELKGKAVEQRARVKAGAAYDVGEAEAYQRSDGAQPAASYMYAAPQAYEEPKAIDLFSSVSSMAGTQEVGELFQYTVKGVTLPRQRSAMIPVVADLIEAERVSIYNHAVLPRNPLNGAIVKNTTGKHLLQGPVTVFDEGSYAGDASIENLPPSQERLLSYAIDLKLQVSAENRREESTLETGRIVKGVLELTRKNISIQDYVIANKSDQDKTLVVEHPLRSGWKLVESPQPMEVTDQLYRFKGAIAAGENPKWTIKEELVEAQTVAILPSDLGTLEYYSQSGEIPKAVKEALIEVMRLKQEVAGTQQKIRDRETESRQITEEQERIRSNMESVDLNSQYYTRLLEKLNNQETQIEKIQGEWAELKQTLEGQQKKLEDYILSLNVGG